MSRRVRVLVGLALTAVTLAGCGARTDQALHLTLDALSTPVPAVPASARSPSENCQDMKASLRPPAALPAPNHMPPGSFMARIHKQGYLIAGVNAGLYQFGYLNPGTGRIEGFEIDLVRELAHAIFGNYNAYRLVALTVPQRIPFVQNGRVDIVVDAVTITCARRRQVDFSTVYYDAKQTVLVPSNSKADGIRALAGKPVCATAQSAPMQMMEDRPDPPQAVGLPQAIDCLVALQEGKVDAISTDSSILLGLRAQDPETKFVGGSLADVPYGMAISKGHPDFVRFVNGVLAKLRATGTWRRLYAKWLGRFGPTPAPPAPVYAG